VIDILDRYSPTNGGKGGIDIERVPDILPHHDPIFRYEAENIRAGIY
jgi:hypothetical protein